MSTERGSTGGSRDPMSGQRQQLSERVARLLPPGRTGPLVRLHWKRGLLWLMLLLGMVVQVIVVVLVWQLVDLSISLMETWTELARKHLEIILT